MTDWSVLIVDDDPQIVSLYAEWLDDYDVRTAQSGTEAIEAIDETVDVALVDRRMPNRSGASVVSEIRDRHDGCRIGMVTGVEPTTDIIEMGFDEYLVKPVSRTELIECVETLLSRSAYGEQLQELYALISKRAALEEEGVGSPDPTETEAYEALTQRIEAMREEVEATTTGLEKRDFEIELRRVAAEATD
ncbi:MAG: response regulator [Natronomonas sp.]